MTDRSRTLPALAFTGADCSYGRRGLAVALIGYSLLAGHTGAVSVNQSSTTNRPIDATSRLRYQELS